MRKFWGILLVSLCLFVPLAIPLALSAQTPSTASTSPATSTDAKPPEGLTAQDVKQLQETAKSLGEAFGVTQPAVNTGTTTPPAGHKTIGNVADKAVDMVGKLVSSAASTLQKVAPDVWRIMIKQQYAKAIGNLMVPFGLFVTAIFLNLLYCKKLRAMVVPDTYGHDDQNFVKYAGGYGVPIVLFVVTIPWLLNNLSDAIKLLINPEYYAIQDLLMMLLNRGIAQ